MFSSDDPRALILKRHFVRKAMELELELDITPKELVQLWKAHQELGMNDEPTASDADLEVDGVPMPTNWTEPATDWMTAKQAAVRKAMAGVVNNGKKASAAINMVAAVRRGELLGAMDARKRGAADTRFWGYKIDGPFELYKLSAVPFDLARELTDFPRRTPRLPNPRQAWRRASGFADSRPFRRKN